MPTWLWWFIPVFVIHAIVAFIMSPPEAVANWFVAKFELHPQLSDETSNVTINGRRLEGEEKSQFIGHFNEAVFIDRYYQFLPKCTGTPVVIETKRGKTDVRYFVYRYDNHVDVFKQYKKKVVAYHLRSKSIQEMSLNLDLAQA